MVFSLLWLSLLLLVLTASPVSADRKWTRNAMLKSFKSLKSVLQMRLKDQQLTSFTKSPDALIGLIGGIQSTLPAILECDVNDLLLLSITEGSAIVQFAVYDPAGEQKYEDKWSAAVKSQNADLAKQFKDIDFAYDPTGEPHIPVPPHPIVTTTQAPDGTTQPATKDTEPTTAKDRTTPSGGSGGDTSSGPKAGIVAGAVVGAIAGVGIIGGGATWAYRRRMKKNEKAIRRKQDLANIGIFGETTPNPHNFRPATEEAQ